MGALDRITHPVWSEEIAGRAPHTRVEVVPGCGHFLLQEDAVATTERIVRWLFDEAS